MLWVHAAGTVSNSTPLTASQSASRMRSAASSAVPSQAPAQGPPRAPAAKGKVAHAAGVEGDAWPQKYAPKQLSDIVGNQTLVGIMPFHPIACLFVGGSV